MSLAAAEPADLENVWRDDVRIATKQLAASTIPHERRLKADVQTGIGRVYDRLQTMVDRRVPPILLLGVDDEWPMTAARRRLSTSI